MQFLSNSYQFFTHNIDYNKTGMLMRPEVDEAKAEAEAKADSHEAEAEIA